MGKRKITDAPKTEKVEEAPPLVRDSDQPPPAKKVGF